MAAAVFADKDASDELWKECALWLTRCGMLRADHRANWADAGIADLANILRDGVLLCKLLNKLDFGCIDMKDVNLKPTMAQFLSLRNIKLFIKTCNTTFGLKEQDLFEPLMLFELTNFHKVLCTLSRLSLSPKALQSNIPGFTAQRDKTKEEEVVYQSLKSVEVPTLSRGIMIVDPICDVTSEEIYQDLCVPQTTLELQPTFEKRDFVIKELLDTEQNYVEVLAKLKKNFMKPLLAIMSPHDHETVFYKINDLYDIHSNFYKELIKTTNDHSLKLSWIFMKWREPFLVYGGYCANLSKATNSLQKLCDTDDDFNQIVIRYEKEDNNGRFKLRDVLSVPMQRILKYHLLLGKLIENTDPNHEEYNDLRRSREGMLDVAAFINEAARDSEHLAVISSLQENIVEWMHTTNNIKLSDYGRLIKDGELKIQAHGDRHRNRYVFIFDKAILICKQLKGHQFAFRDIIIISEYHVDERHNRATLKSDVRTHFQFHLVRNDSVMVYTIFVRTFELKEQMIKAINDALEKIHPKALSQTDHVFELQTFDRPTQCHYCSKYLRGLIYQGYRCKVCQIATHKDCISCSGRCGTPPPLQMQSSYSSQTSMNGDDLSLREKLWFVGEMDRSKAHSELDRRENGTFLVRIRPQNDDKDKYALTLKTNGTVKHMKICNTDTEDKKYYLSLSRFFNSIEDLILNYQENSLKENFERLEENSKLLWPYRQLHAVAVQNFEPSDANQLSLTQGDHLVVVAKEGYRENYWKGRTEANEVGFFPSNFVRIEGEVKFNQ